MFGRILLLKSIQSLRISLICQITIQVIASNRFWRGRCLLGSINWCWAIRVTTYWVLLRTVDWVLRWRIICYHWPHRLHRLHWRYSVWVHIRIRVLLLILWRHVRNRLGDRLESTKLFWVKKIKLVSICWVSLRHIWYLRNLWNNWHYDGFIGYFQSLKTKYVNISRLLMFSWSCVRIIRRVKFQYIDWFSWFLCFLHLFLLFQFLWTDKCFCWTFIWFISRSVTCFCH